MGKFEDFWDESDEDFFKSSRKKIDNLPKTEDTRTQAQKDRDVALRAESDEWARSRAEHTKRNLEEKIRRYHQRTGVSKPRGVY
jgi:hypothetical protein